MQFVKILNYLLSWRLSKKEEKIADDDFIAHFDTNDCITLLKCKICTWYTAQIRTEARLHNSCGHILHSILLYVDSVTYVPKTNAYNHVKAWGLHGWVKKKFLMNSYLEYGCILTELEAATCGVL